VTGGGGRSDRGVGVTGVSVTGGVRVTGVSVENTGHLRDLGHASESHLPSISWFFALRTVLSPNPDFSAIVGNDGQHVFL
jgi:hypothetical protein